jgi:hypothetical protein
LVSSGLRVAVTAVPRAKRAGAGETNSASLARVRICAGPLSPHFATRGAAATSPRRGCETHVGGMRAGVARPGGSRRRGEQERLHWSESAPVGRRGDAGRPGALAPGAAGSARLSRSGTPPGRASVRPCVRRGGHGFDAGTPRSGRGRPGLPSGVLSRL